MQINQNILDLQKRWSAIESRVADRKTILSDIEKDVKQKKFMVEQAEEVWPVLEGLQEQMHERSLGRFESLLTSLVRDVFPDKEMSVKLSLSIERNQPALRFMMEDKDGNQEDILSGKGGSITNILSLGLKFIVLAQSAKLAPVIVLDEADCWLQTDRVPAFASVVNQLSDKLGIQVIMISHHDADMFPGAHIANLRNNGNFVVIN